VEGLGRDAIYAEARLGMLGLLEVLRSENRERCRSWRPSNAWQLEEAVLLLLSMLLLLGLLLPSLVVPAVRSFVELRPYRLNFPFIATTACADMRSLKAPVTKLRVKEKTVKMLLAL